MLQILIFYFNSISRVAKEEKSSRTGAQEKVQEKLGFLGVRKKDSIHDQKNYQKAMVLLVCHCFGLSQHLRRGCGTL